MEDGCSRDNKKRDATSCASLPYLSTYIHTSLELGAFFLFLSAPPPLSLFLESEVECKVEATRMLRKSTSLRVAAHLSVRSRRAPPVPLIVLPKSCSCRCGPCPPPPSLVWGCLFSDEVRCGGPAFLTGISSFSPCSSVREGLRRCRLAGDHCTPSRLQSSILNDTGVYIDPALLLSDRMAACLSNTLADLSHERRKVAEQADALEQQADEIEHELTRVPFWPSDDWLGDGGAGYDCPTEYEILPYALLSVQARVRLTSRAASARLAASSPTLVPPQAWVKMQDHRFTVFYSQSIFKWAATIGITRRCANDTRTSTHTHARQGHALSFAGSSKSHRPASAASDRRRRRTCSKRQWRLATTSSTRISVTAASKSAIGSGSVRKRR